MVNSVEKTVNAAVSQSKLKTERDCFSKDEGRLFSRPLFSFTIVYFDSLNYFFGAIASFAAFATRNFTTVLALIWIGSPVCGFLPMKELILEKGIAALFCDYRELLKNIQNSYNESVKTTELDVLRPVFETEVLVLDELGAVKPTEWVWDTVSLILNTRYNDNRTTIITTNFDDKPAGTVSGPRGAARDETLGDRIGERMRSRLHEMCRIIKLDGSDFRQKFRSASFR